MLRGLLYACMFGTFAYALYWDINHVPGRVKHHSWPRNKLKFLTLINLCLITLYFALATVRAFIYGGHTKKKSSLVSSLDKLYANFVFPMGMAVVILFWGLYFIDRDLVLPKHLDRIIPPWLNHILHTCPGVFLILDTVLTHHKMPSKRAGLIAGTSLGAAYCTSLFVWHHVEGWWVYPVFDVLDNTGKFLFCAFGIVLINSLCLLCHLFNYLVWGDGPQEEAGSQKAKKSN